jgi:hypothetical protein
MKRLRLETCLLSYDIERQVIRRGVHVAARCSAHPPPPPGVWAAIKRSHHKTAPPMSVPVDIIFYLRKPDNVVASQVRADDLLSLLSTTAIGSGAAAVPLYGCSGRATGDLVLIRQMANYGRHR